jgi:zinc protease
MTKNFRQSQLRITVSAIGLLLASPAVAQTAAVPAADTATETTSPSQPWAHEQSDVPADPNVRYGLLPNGLRYAILPNRTPAGKASLWIRVDAGSLMENEDQLGLAHFMEHMTFNGTEELPENELIRRLERLGLKFGADLNAGTTFDQTFYRLDMPKNDEESIDTGLHILRQQASAALMEPKHIDEERGVIRGEERLRNSPSAVIGVKQLEILGAGTLVPKRMPIGDMDVIEKAPRERFVEYYQRYYRPSRTTVIAVGDFDADTMEAKIKLQFADWRPKAPDGPDPDLGSIVPQELQTHVYVEGSLSPSVSINWITPPKRAADTLANRKDDLVRGLALAVLNRRLAETGRLDNPPFLAAQGAESEAFRSLRMATISGSYLPGKWKETLTAMDQAVRQFSQYGVTQAELDREIKSWRTRYEDGVKSATTRDSVGLAGRLVYAVNDREVFVSPATSLEIFEAAVKGLTARKISGVARTIFQGQGPIISLLSSDPVEGGNSALRAAYDTSVRLAVAPVKAHAPKSWAYTDFGAPGRVVDVSQPDVLGATTYSFANGVRLTVKRVDFNKNQISVGLLTGIGERNFTPDTIDPRATALGAVTSGGLGKMTIDDVSRALTGRNIGAGLSTLGQRFLLSGGTRPEDLQLQMQYMAALLTDPGLRANEFNKAIASAPTGWALANASPDGVFGLQGTPLISGGDQRVAKAPPEVSNGWKLEPLRDDIRRMISSGPIHIVMAGDLDVEQAVQTVATTFGALPPRPPANPAAPGADRRSFGKPTAEPVVLMHNGLLDQSLGTVTWPTTDLIGGNRKLARELSLLSAVFQLRANDVIREKEALAYSPRVGGDYSADYQGYGTLTASAATSPEKLSAFYAAIETIAAELRDKPIGEDELHRARAPMIERFGQSLKTNGGWYGMLLAGAYAPDTVNDALAEPDVLKAVTPARLQELARQYLVPGKAIRISVLPSASATDAKALAQKD